MIISGSRFRSFDPGPCDRLLVPFLRGLSRVPQVQAFHFIPGPRGFPQKLQTGFDARVIRKAPDGNGLPHLLPTILFYQPGKHHFQGDAVKRIYGFPFGHRVIHLKRHQDQLMIVQFLIERV